MLDRECICGIAPFLVRENERRRVCGADPIAHRRAEAGEQIGIDAIHEQQRVHRERLPAPRSLLPRCRAVEQQRYEPWAKGLDDPGGEGLQCHARHIRIFLPPRRPRNRPPPPIHRRPPPPPPPPQPPPPPPRP